MKKGTRNGLIATGVVATIIAGVLITAKTAKAAPAPGTGQIYGGVTEDGDLQIPVPNMLVIANGHSTTTDINGGWELWLPAGSYTVTISKEGYATQSRQMAAEVGKSNGWHIEYGPW